MAVSRPYPRRTLEGALRVPNAIKEHNGGNPWATDQVAKALGLGAKTGNFYYVTAASRDYGLTEGTRETTKISLTDLGRRAVYPQTPDGERAAYMEAFLRVDLFRKVLDFYGGNNLPEGEFLTNALHQTFGLDPQVHEEFIDIFRRNCRFLGIGTTFAPSATSSSGLATPTPLPVPDRVTVVATPQARNGDAPVCFVIMPFTERDDRHDTGFFDEVLKQIFIPAGTEAGFVVKTALRQGSDVIQSTIVHDLLEADLVLADLTEHNPNVLFELGMRMREDKPVALVRARGTGAIFDVDNMLRVAEYSPNLWPSTIQADLPVVTEHIRGTWENRESGVTYMKLLHRDAL